jgi:hypothetical protein
MLHRPSTQTNLEHRVLFLVLRTEHNTPDKPKTPKHRARYIAKGAEDSHTPTDPLHTWTDPIAIEHGQKVTVGVRNPEPDGHPNFTPHELTLRRDFMMPWRALEEYVTDEKRMLEEGVGIAAVEWYDHGDVSERIAQIEVRQGDAKSYISWEVMQIDIF